MDADPVRRTPTTPFPAHFEGLLPDLAGQRFYSQMIDGWVWNIWRGQVVAAGTFQARPIEFTPPLAFASEMRRWGVSELFVWTDESREYLARSGLFAERWRGRLWSEFELLNADVRSATAGAGTVALSNLTFFGGDVDLSNVRAGDEVVVRANYYPAWRATTGSDAVNVYAVNGQLAFRAPQNGSYTVHLVYPRYRWLNVTGLVALILGIAVLTRLSR
jgi:hypothetical protein